MLDPLKLYWFFGLLQSSYSLAELYLFCCLLTGLASPPPSMFYIDLPNHINFL